MDCTLHTHHTHSFLRAHTLTLTLTLTHTHTHTHTLTHSVTVLRPLGDLLTVLTKESLDCRQWNEQRTTAVCCQLIIFHFSHTTNGSHHTLLVLLACSLP